MSSYLLIYYSLLENRGNANGVKMVLEKRDGGMKKVKRCRRVEDKNITHKFIGFGCVNFQCEAKYRMSLLSGAAIQRQNSNNMYT